MAETPKVHGRDVKALRKVMGLTQPELAKVLRVSTPYVSMIESGKKEVEDTALSVLLLWLMSFFGIEGGQTPHPCVPLVIAPTPAPTPRRPGGRGPYKVRPDESEPGTDPQH